MSTQADYELFNDGLDDHCANCQIILNTYNRGRITQECEGGHLTSNTAVAPHSTDPEWREGCVSKPRASVLKLSGIEPVPLGL